MKSKLKLSRISIAFTMLVMVIVSSNLNWGKQHWRGILEADAKGYYAYLPAVFIYQDLNFGFFDEIEKEKYYIENLFYDYRANFNNRIINKYYCGTAIAELPFFLIAHFLSTILDRDADGFSSFYTISVNIAALFYLFLGLVFVNKTLSLYHIGEWQKALTLVAAALGTNLFYYSIGEPGMSHVFSFAFVAMFIYFSKKLFLTSYSGHLLWIAFPLGMITLIRPINSLIILTWPFLAGDPKSLFQTIWQQLKSLKTMLLAAIIFVAVVSIQLIIYKISTGSFFVYAYGGETFDFTKPHMIDFLFSYKKGLFLYTPIYLISLAGIWHLWKTNRFSAISIAAFLFLITYIFSSWWMWFYGGSFSTRVFVELLPIFMILMAIALQNIVSKAIKRTYVGLTVVLILVCQIQTYQYRYYDIHWAEMTKEKYWDVFMRIDRRIK